MKNNYSCNAPYYKEKFYIGAKKWLLYHRVQCDIDSTEVVISTCWQCDSRITKHVFSKNIRPRTNEFCHISGFCTKTCSTPYKTVRWRILLCRYYGATLSNMSLRVVRPHIKKRKTFGQLLNSRKTNTLAFSIVTTILFQRKIKQIIPVPIWWCIWGVHSLRQKKHVLRAISCRIVHLWSFHCNPYTVWW